MLLVVSPAERSGITGFKPTRGLLSSGGIIYASKRSDTVGLFTRNVSNAMQQLLELIYYSDHVPLGTKLKIIQDIQSMTRQARFGGLCIGTPGLLSEVRRLRNAKLAASKLY